MENLTSTTATAAPVLIYSQIIKVFRMYCTPVLCVVSLLGNSAMLIGMARVKSDFSKSVRFYYSVFSFAELLVVGGYFLIGDFLEYGIAALVSDGAYYPIRTYDATVWSCKLLNAVWMGPDFISGLTLVCLGIERIIAITWPLRAKMILTLRNSVIFELTVNVLIIGTFLPLLIIDYSLVHGDCTYDFSLPFTQFYIMFEEGIPLISTFVSLGISIYLIVKVVQSLLARKHISSAGSISARELSNISTLLLLDLAHLIVYLPDGIFYFMYSIMKGNPELHDAVFTVAIHRLANLCDEFTLIPHTLTFFITFFRSQAFRKALFGKFIS